MPPLGVSKEPSTAPIQGVSEALARLKSAGLVVEGGQGPTLHIVGGRSVSGDEIPVYQESFGILADATGQLLAIVSGPGQLATEIPVPTLAAAVEAILDVYKKRGALPRDADPR